MDRESKVARHALTVAAAAALLGGCATVTPVAPAVGTTPARPLTAAEHAAQVRAATHAPVATPAAAPAAPPAAAAPVAAASPGSTPGALPPGMAPGGPPPFAMVLRDAKRIDGAFTAWRKDERVWLELKPSDFDRPFFLSPKLAQGVGEPELWGGQMLPLPSIVTFRRMNQMIQLVASNTQLLARAGTPEARALSANTSPSLLAAAPVASQPHPDRKTVLVDASLLFGGDMLSLAARLQRTFRQSYGLDRANSGITDVRGTPDLLVLEAQHHFATAALATAATTPPGAPPGPAPSFPRGVPDPRSLLLGVHYSLMTLPAQPMAGRRADQRLGHFVSTHLDLGDDREAKPEVRLVRRWRLEKKDPSAPVSEPIKPITFWLDRNIPPAYREAITAGILGWNPAFERIGFRGALAVKVQPDDADWDTLDATNPSVRWLINRQSTFAAIGPSQVDPRSGEIIDADIAIDQTMVRMLRQWRAVHLPPGIAAGSAGSSALASAHDDGEERCEIAAVAADQAALLAAAWPDLEPGSPEVEAFVHDLIVSTTLHEVGHALGLRHNFRGSRVRTEAQLADPNFTGTKSGSIMDYVPVHVARPNEPRVKPFQTELGPYDFWAIEYAYKPIPREQEPQELARIAARSSEPELAFGSDLEHHLGIDPDALQHDLGDPLAFGQRRLDLAEQILDRQRRRTMNANDDWSVVRASVAFALREAQRAAGVLLRQVGGLRTLRDFPGSGREPLQVVEAATQRAAVDLLASRVLAPGALTVPPEVEQRLAPDFFARDAGDQPTEYLPAQQLLQIQVDVLNRLLGDDVVRRMLDNEQSRLRPGAEPYRLAEMWGKLDDAVWLELGSGTPITPGRRNLQREHVNRLAALAVRPTSYSRADARSLSRERAQTLLQRLDRAVAAASTAPRAGDAQATRLHLRDSADTLRQALAATVNRQSP